MLLVRFPFCRYVGKLVGRYYDSKGNPTKYLKSAEAKAAKGARLLEKQKKEEAKQTSCNSKWSQQDGGEASNNLYILRSILKIENYVHNKMNCLHINFQVWCDSGYPRLVQRPHEIALTGKMSKQCVCLKDHELNRQGLEVYNGCDHLASSCRV